MKTRNWTKLKRTMPRFDSGQMRFTLNALSILSINSAAFVALRRPAAVEIFYDEGEGLIGLVPAPIEAPDACPVRDIACGSGKRVTMKRFCNRFGLKPGRTIYFRNPAFDPDGTLVLNYRQALEGGSSRVAESGSCEVTELQS